MYDLFLGFTHVTNLLDNGCHPPYWCRRIVRNNRGPKVLCIVFGFSFNSSREKGKGYYRIPKL